MGRGPLGVVALVCLLTAGRLPAQTVRYVAQERSVRSSVSEQYFSEEGMINVGDTDRVDAADFGPFDARASAQHDDPVYPSGYSDVSQHSTLEETGISISGDWSNQAFTDNGGFSFATTTVATFDVLDRPLAYDLIYRLETPRYERWGHQVDLLLRRVDGEGGDVFRVAPEYDGDSDIAVGDASGVLQPGRYEFQYVDRFSGSIGDNGENWVSLTFTVVPEPGAAVMVLGGLAVALGTRRRGC